MECSECSVGVMEAPSDSSLALDVEAASNTTELNWLRWLGKGDEVGFVGGDRNASAGIPDDGEVFALGSGVCNGVAKANGGLERHSEKRVMGFRWGVVAGKS